MYVLDFVYCLYITGQVRVGSAHCGLAPFVYCIIVVIENGKCLPITAKEIELWLRWYPPFALWVYKTLNTI